MGYISNAQIIIGFILSLSSLGAVLLACLKWVVKKFDEKLDEKLKPFSDEMQDIKEHTEENYLGILQMKIMSDEIPLSERVIAGEKYIKAGGNGAVKARYKVLREQYEKELKNEVH